MKAQFLPGNQLTLLETGASYFPALQEAIDTAQREIFLETYIFEYDSTGQMIAGALARAARRGVRVRVLIDGFGCRGFARELREELEESGVQLLVYRPELGRFRLKRHRLRRLHRKVSVFDGRLAFVGGINIIDDMHTPGHIPPRYDYAVRVEGPLLGPIHESSRRLWALVAWASFRRRFREQTFTPASTAWRGNVLGAYLVRDNLRHRRAIEEAYLEAIAGARHEIILANAYFLPGVRFRHALMEAARRGVRVIVLLQGRVEYVLLHYATQALYGALLSGGVRIFEYHKSFLHAKVAVIDGHWATIGSCNIDPFSLLLAREANVVALNEGFAAELSTSLQRAMDTGAQELKREDWKRKPLFYRLASWASYSLVRLMMGLAGYGGEH